MPPTTTIRNTREATNSRKLAIAPGRLEASGSTAAIETGAEIIGERLFACGGPSGKGGFSLE